MEQTKRAYALAMIKRAEAELKTMKDNVAERMSDLAKKQANGLNWFGFDSGLLTSELKAIEKKTNELNGIGIIFDIMAEE